MERCLLDVLLSTTRCASLGLCLVNLFCNTPLAPMFQPSVRCSQLPLARSRPTRRRLHTSLSRPSRRARRRLALYTTPSTRVVEPRRDASHVVRRRRVLVPRGDGASASVVDRQCGGLATLQRLQGMASCSLVGGDEA